jgi:hypothetical protein
VKLFIYMLLRDRRKMEPQTFIKKQNTDEDGRIHILQLLYSTTQVYSLINTALLRQKKKKSKIK